MKLVEGNQVLRCMPENNEEDFFMKDFCQTLVTMKMLRVKGKTTFVPKDKYYLHNIRENEYTILSSDAQFFIYKFVSRFGAKKLSPVIVDETEYDDIDVPFKNTFEPRDEQEFFINGMLKERNPDRVLVMARTGYGKMQPDDTPILTERGWETIGSSYVGKSVTTYNGKETFITSVSKHYNKQMYEVALKDGRKTECGLEHLWKCKIGGLEQTINTKVLKACLKTKIRVEIPLFKPYKTHALSELHYIASTVLMFGVCGDDYMMLGESHLSKLYGVVSDNEFKVVGQNISFTHFKEVTSIVRKMRHNPSLYFAKLTVEERHSILRGFHLEGIRNNSGIKYVTTNRTLYEIVKHLLYSTGYQVDIKYENVVYVLRGFDDSYVEVVSCEPTRVCNATCIEVYNESELYVTTDYIVTHNTYMANLVISKLKKRTLFYLLAGHISKWILDIKTYFDVEDDDIFVLSGKKSFCKLMGMDKVPPFILVSGSTFHNFDEYFLNTIKADETEYCITPKEFMRKLKIHTFVNDETHKSFSNVYRAVLALDPKKVIGLTATLITKDKALNRFHYGLFTEDMRLDLLTYKSYIKLENVGYSIDTARELRVNGGYGYNHDMFEDIIIRNSRLLEDYLEMIRHYVDMFYIKKNRGNDRCLIFASSLKMVTVITNAVKEWYPTLDVREYTGKDKYENALEPDIRVTHPQVFAEAIDVKNLIFTLNTVNIDSIATYIQMIGRLREIKGFDVKFVQLYCKNIPKHFKYISGNKEYVVPRVEDYIIGSYNKMLRY
jgi:superfamily II DNA or RNA helicase